MTNHRWALTAAVALVLMSGCTPLPETNPEEVPGLDLEGDQAFGEVVQVEGFPDVKVTKIMKWTASERAVPASVETTGYEVLIINDTDEVVDLTSVLVTGSIGEQDDRAPVVYDPLPPEGGFTSDLLEGEIQPGEERVLQIAFALPDGTAHAIVVTTTNEAPSVSFKP